MSIVRGYTHVKEWLGQQVLLPKWLSHMAVGKVPHHVELCRDCSMFSSNLCFCHAIMAITLPQSNWSKRKQGSYDVFYDLITYCHFYYILSAVTKHSPGKRISLHLFKGRSIKVYVAYFKAIKIGCVPCCLPEYRVNPLWWKITSFRASTIFNTQCPRFQFFKKAGAVRNRTKVKNCKQK